MQLSSVTKPVLSLIAGVLMVSILGFKPLMAQRTAWQESVALRLAQADVLLKAENYGAALQSYKELSSLTLTSDQMPQVLYGQGIAALYLGMDEGAKSLADLSLQFPTHGLAGKGAAAAGSYYYNKKEYGRAIPFLQKSGRAALPQKEKDEMLFRLGYCYLSQKAFARADSAFSIVKDRQHQYTAAANYFSSYIKVKAGNTDAALPGLEVAEKDKEFSAMVPLLRAVIYYRKKAFAQVVSYGEQVLGAAEKPDSPEEIAILVAESHYELGSYAKAAPFFEQYAQVVKQLPAALRYRMGYSFLKAGSFDKAEKQLVSLTQVKADTVQKKDSLVQFASYYLASAYIRQNKRDLALAAYDQARNLSVVPKIKQLAAFNYGKLHYDLGNYSEAITALKEYLDNFKSGKERDEAEDLLGESYLKTTDYDQALSFLEGLSRKSARVEKAYQRACYMKATSYYNEKNFKDAILWYDKSLKYPEDPEMAAAAQFWTGESLQGQGEYAKSVPLYESVLKSRDAQSILNYADRARYSAGYAFYNTGKYKEAAIYFNQYCQNLEKEENRLNYLDGLVRLADCQLALKSYDNALATYQRAINQGSPDADYAAYQRGVVYIYAGKKGQARIAFEEMRKLFPQSKFKDEALFQLASLDFDEGEYAKAIVGFTQLLTLKPMGEVAAATYLRRGSSYANTSQQVLAIADYKKVLTDYTSSKSAKSALLALQEAVGTEGNVEEFNGLLQKYKAANPEGGSTESIEFSTAKNLYFSGSYAKAIESFLAFQRSYPESANGVELNFYLAESYNRVGKRSDALATHAKVLETGKGFFFVRSLNRLGDLNLQDQQSAVALGYFKQLLANARNKKEEAVALTGIMESWYGTKNYDSTAVVADQILSRESLPIDLENKAALYKGKSDIQKGNLDAALTQLLTTANQSQDATGAEAQYLIAEIQATQKKHKESIQSCFELNKRFEKYAKWYDKSFLLVADNYAALGENYQAKYTLEKIIEKSPDKATQDAAKERLAKLKTS